MAKNYLGFILGSVFLLTSCEKANLFGAQKTTYSGYVEDKTIAITAPQSGWINQVNVDRGDEVHLDQALFSLDDTQSKAQLNSARAKADAAKATAIDLSKGARPQDLAPLEASVRQAQSAYELARANFQRYEALNRQGYASQSTLDSYKSANDTAYAALQVAIKTLDDKKLAARDDEKRAALATAQAAGEDVAAQDWQTSDRSVHARTQGVVDERLREVGEFVAQGTPVLTLRPTGRQFVRFYVPQSVVSDLKLGQLVSLTCDGCHNQRARIRFVNAQPEFTPPVIYSLKERQKLVFLIEAVPEHPETLHAGQAIDIAL